MVEFHDLGAHCSREDCKQLDFLPFKCRLCNHTYCAEHRSFDHHVDCSGPKTNKAVPCPLCKNPVNGTSSLSPASVINPLIEAHIAAGCPTPEEDRKNRLAKKAKCGVKKCRSEPSSTSFSCKQCSTVFCIKHRHPVDHQCGKKDTPDAAGDGKAASRVMRSGMSTAGAAALARFNQKGNSSPSLQVKG
ncbi:hypothetical protein BC829DRAFT_402139 [Chytridium lagenaria]|nr:hypothetical protein BC829DRAFT_402139 [Chytridium lagenaria]